MFRIRLAAVVGAGMLTLAAIAPVAAAPAATLPVTASVVSQSCLNGDFVQVTLQASSPTPAAFAWDFTNNGSIDTRFSTNPTVTATYPDETAVTARVIARDQAGNRGTDAVSFTTMRCGG